MVSSTAAPVQPLRVLRMPNQDCRLRPALTLGSFQEFNDAQALKYSSRGVNSLNILTAGSGQTPGTYTVTANAGGAVASSL